MRDPRHKNTVRRRMEIEHLLRCQGRDPIAVVAIPPDDLLLLSAKQWAAELEAPFIPSPIPGEEHGQNTTTQA